MKTPWGTPAALRGLWRFGVAAWRQFRQDKVVIRASGLAYASLLATVPLTAVLFALFSAFGAFDEIETRVKEFLFSQFLPTRQEEVISFIEQFTANVDKLGFFGFLGLIVTSVLLLDAIESNFNEIWHARSRRKIVSKITSYTSVLVFGTLFIGASLTVSARLEALLFTGGILDRGLVRKVADWSLPLVLALSGFLLLYLIVPYARVRLRSALLGAAVAGVLWELAKNVFASSVGQSVRYGTLYGSLAVFPIFLVWLYVTWVIVLLGLEITFTHQHFTVLERERARERGPGPQPVLLALEIFGAIAERFHQGKPPPSTEDLSQRCLVKVERAESAVERLREAGLVHDVELDSGAIGLTPATSLERVRVADVAGLYLHPVEALDASEDSLERAVVALAARFRQAGEAAVGETTFQDIVAGRIDDPPPDEGRTAS